MGNFLNTMFTQTASAHYHAHSRRMWTALGFLIAVGFLGVLSMNPSSTPAHRRLPQEEFMTRWQIENIVKTLEENIHTMEENVGGLEKTDLDSQRISNNLQLGRKILRKYKNLLAENKNQRKWIKVGNSL